MKGSVAVSVPGAGGTEVRLPGSMGVMVRGGMGHSVNGSLGVQCAKGIVVCGSVRGQCGVQMRAV